MTGWLNGSSAHSRKHASTKGAQWDRYLSSVLWAYQNTPHESIGEKPSFLLNCQTPSEAALLPPASATVADYREQLVLSLSTARALAVDSIKQAQEKYKRLYDRKSSPSHLKVGDWVFVRFPQDEVGKMRKLSRPWHEPYRIGTKCYSGEGLPPLGCGDSGTLVTCGTVSKRASTWILLVWGQAAFSWTSS